MMKASQVCWLLLMVCGWMPSVQGWGKEGHEMVANLAYKLLANTTRTMVDRILVNHPFQHFLASSKHKDEDKNTPLGDVADWADVVRFYHAYHWSYNLHFIDIRDNSVTGGCPVFHQTEEQQEKCRFIYERDCEDNACVAGAINNYTRHLSDYQQQLVQLADTQPVQLSTGNPLLRGGSIGPVPFLPDLTTMESHSSRPEPTRLVQESLMFLTHFVGDLHQPLHCARTTDRGGNSIDVVFDEKFTNQKALIKMPNYFRRDRHPHHHNGTELHAVWDSGIIDRSLREDFKGSRSAMEDEISSLIQNAKASGDIKEWLKCPDGRSKDCTSLWAEESFGYALKWAYGNAGDDETEVTPGTHLSMPYYQTRLVIIKQRIAVAGVRLAESLEMALGATTMKPPAMSKMTIGIQ